MVISVLENSLMVVLIYGILKLIEVRMNHKHSEKSDNRKTDTAILASIKAILHYRLKNSMRECLEAEHVSFDDNADIIKMWHIYKLPLKEGGLDGDKSLDSLYEQYKKLPIK